MEKKLFKLNTESARQVQGLSGRIDEKGKYKGVIEYAKIYTIPTGSKWVEFSFKDDGGQGCKLSTCVESKEGKETYGMKIVHAVMACCSVRETTIVNKTVKEWDFDVKAMMEVSVEVLSELTDRKVGFALFRVDKTSLKGRDYFQMEIAAPFDYETEQTSGEKLDSLPAKLLTKLVISLRDKDQREKPDNYGGAQQAPQQGGGQDDFLDDIPF